jgi:hypothetical protein
VSKQEPSFCEQKEAKKRFFLSGGEAPPRPFRAGPVQMDKVFLLLFLQKKKPFQPSFR